MDFGDQFAVLDCADGSRRDRLMARPLWRERVIDRHLSFATHMRSVAKAVFDTDSASGPHETAGQVALWVRGLLT